MKYPKLSITKQSPITLSAFPGYDHRLKAPSGSLFEAENLSLRRYPMLAPRLPRHSIPLTAPQGICAKDALCVVDDNILYVNFKPTPLTDLSDGEKQLVSMGAYVLIFPDKLYYNTADPSDYGSMEADFTYSGSVSYAPCDSEGKPYGNIASAEPESPENGQLWLSEGTLLEYSSASGIWAEHSSVYTRLSLPTTGQIPRLFRQYDGVELSGCALEELNGSHVLQAVGGSDSEGDYMVLSGLCPSPFTDEEAALHISRKVPDMDFVCQCRNRLWGCRYGNDGEKNINELYCSALGDFRNFSQFMGLSTDSWRATLGSDGGFTGAISFLDSPCFFKEDRIHRITVSPTGAHRVSETACRGVQKGSHKSLCVVGESLFYKAETELCQWQGGFPVSVSAQLGEVNYSKARSGAVGGSYYVSMEDEEGKWHLFVYDTKLRLWQRQDSLKALSFARQGSLLWCIDEEGGCLTELSGNPIPQELLAQLQPLAEDKVRWSAQSGIMDFETADRKYLSRLRLSLGMEEGSSLAAHVRYDSQGDWHSLGEIGMKQRGTVLMPLRPRRCHHLELRLTGEGELTLYSLSALYEAASDV